MARARALRSGTAYVEAAIACAWTISAFACAIQAFAWLALTGAPPKNAESSASFIDEARLSRDVVSVAGSVIVRQRPSTAKDVVFMTMEDETGYSNFLILPDVFDKFRSIIVSSNFLVVRGIHEQRGMIKALYFQPINAFITKIASHDFQ